MDIKVVDSQGNEPQDLEIKTPEATPVVTGGMLEQSVGQMFDLTPSEISKYSDKIGLLIDYAKTVVDDPSEMNIKWAIRSLQGKVGTPPLGEKWVTFLTKYAWLKLDELRIKKEVQRYEHSN